jgi:6-phosphogluconolactonase
MPGLQQVRWHAQDGPSGVIAEASRRIDAAARESIGRNGVFRIVLSGGETPRRLYEALAASAQGWGAWQVYFGDERCLPAHDAGRNSRMAQEAWLGRVGLPAAQVHPIPAELGPHAGAQGYTRTLDGVEAFDLVLLGLGEDGHTASLFPGQEWGTDPAFAAALAVLDAPRPPAQRVSLSAWRLSRSRGVLVLVTGASKREAVRRWRAGERLPIAAVTPSGGLDVLVDRAAA